ncbi:MAG: hypothetical protein JW751_04595 [Polyangiaceae bacterium]|nr:hypothetical protein [Polyangiaceae bacterium]
MTTPIKPTASTGLLAQGWDRSTWRRLASLTLLMGMAAGIVLGCSKGDSSLPDPGAGPVLVLPTDDPRCAEGSTRACGTTLGVQDDQLTCYEGLQTCVGGTWGPCTDGVIVERAKPDPRAIAELRAQDTGVPWELCLTASNGAAGAAGAGTLGLVFNNPCDPRCRIQYQPGSVVGGAVTVGTPHADRDGVLAHFDPLPTSCTNSSDCQSNQRCEHPTTDFCAHPTCMMGSSLDPACDPCVADICDTTDGDGNEACCTSTWDAGCVGMVRTVCHAFCPDPSGLCTHPLCEEGEGLVPGCDDPMTGCVSQVCAVDPDCCGGGADDWDIFCVLAVMDVCGHFSDATLPLPKTSPLLAPAVEDETRMELAVDQGSYDADFVHYFGEIAPLDPAGPREAMAGGLELAAHHSFNDTEFAHHFDDAAPLGPAGSGEVVAHAEIALASAPSATAPKPASTRARPLVRRVPLLDPSAYAPLADLRVTIPPVHPLTWTPLPGGAPSWAVAQQSYAAVTPGANAIDGILCEYTVYSRGDLVIDNINAWNVSSGSTSARVAAGGSVTLQNSSTTLNLPPDVPLIAGGFVVVKSSAQINGSVAAIGSGTAPSGANQNDGPIQIVNSGSKITRATGSTLNYAAWAQKVGNYAVTIDGGRISGGVKTASSANISLKNGGTYENTLVTDGAVPTPVTDTFSPPPTSTCSGTVSESIENSAVVYTPSTARDTVSIKNSSITFNGGGIYTFKNLTLDGGANVILPNPGSTINPVHIVVCNRLVFNTGVHFQNLTSIYPMGVRWWVLGTGTSTAAAHINATINGCTDCGFLGVLSVPNGKAYVGQYNGLYGMIHAAQAETVGVSIVQLPDREKACDLATCFDGIENGTETDVDCGGTCAEDCDNGEGCLSDGDCESDACCNNVCVADKPAACDDGNSCTTDVCNATSACTHVNRPAGSSCNDGNACTGSDVCDGSANCAGTYITCNDSNPCTDDSCNPAAGCVFTNDNSNTCSDGKTCTTDTCSGGTCVYSPSHAVCDDGNSCTDDACDPPTGNATTGCRNTNDDSNSCTDGRSCTTDACVSGTCTPTPNDAVCDDGNPCTDDACVPATGDAVTGCLLTNNDSNTCDDASVCTTGDHCSSGSCVGTFITCEDSNPCTDDKCDPLTGCYFENDNSNACSDGSVCTDDICSAGTCVLTPITCNDGNPCTDDDCDAVTGCYFTNDDGNTCSDTNLCTTAEHCSAGSCDSSPVTCDDGNPCTDDACDPVTGCYFPNNDGNACTDGNLCTNDACSAGACTATLVDCDDADDCTLETCDPATGCQHTYSAALCVGGYCDYPFPDDSACVPWASGETDNACVGLPDLALDIPCLSPTGQGLIPVCNHGTAEAPTGLKIHFFDYDPATPLSNWGKDDASGALAAPTCTTTRIVPPGECVLMPCGVFDGTGDRYLIMVNPSSDVPSVPECNHQDNWSVFLNDSIDGACAGSATASSGIEEFEPAECGGGERLQWTFFTWEAEVPDDSEIRFAFQSCADSAYTDCSSWVELDNDGELIEGFVPVPLADGDGVMAAGHNVDGDLVTEPNPEVLGRASCTYGDAIDPDRRCPVVLGDFLRDGDPYVRMHVAFVPNTVTTAAPVLLSRHLSYTCVDYE